MSLSGIVGATVSAPIAGLASIFGTEWSLRYAFVLFVIATIGAIRLPAAVDSSEGEGEMTWRKEGGTSSRGRMRTRIPAAVAFALRANCGPVVHVRLPADVRGVPAPQPRRAPGQLARRGRDDRHRHRRRRPRPGARHAGGGAPPAAHPAVAVVLALVADAAAALVAALFYGVWALALLGLVAGLAQSLAKFSLDATIQRHIPPRVQASAFGRSDTTCQLAWVLGGFVGIALPLDPPRLGLSVAFVLVAAWTAFVLTTVPKGKPGAEVAPRTDQADVDTQPMSQQRP